MVGRTVPVGLETTWMYAVGEPIERTKGPVNVERERRVRSRNLRGLFLSKLERFIVPREKNLSLPILFFLL